MDSDGDDRLVSWYIDFDEPIGDKLAKQVRANLRSATQNRAVPSRRFWPQVVQDEETGSVYISLSDKSGESGCVSHTVQWVPDRICADYGADGELLGVEIL